MSRLYTVESRFTSTGVTSDHRLPVRSADAGAILELIEAALGAGTAGARAKELGAQPKVAAFVQAAKDDIKNSGGKFAVIAGDTQPAEVHARVLALHQSQGAMGKTIHMIDEPLKDATTANLASLVADMKSGAVKTLLILGGNPVYDAPADLDFASAMASCATADRKSVV